MILGVSGSRHVPKRRVMQKFFKFLCMNNVKELHHGDCVGFDEECHKMCANYKIRTVIHPPDVEALRANCAGDVVLKPLPYLERNRAIVKSVNFLIAAPDGPERQRSGTWSTVRYAKRIGVKGVVWL